MIANDSKAMQMIAKPCKSMQKQLIMIMIMIIDNDYDFYKK